MQVFHCPGCKGPLWFDNDRCACGQTVGFDPEAQAMMATDARCANHALIACNWLPEPDSGGLCRSCAMTDILPDLREPANLPHWARTETAKRWMLANLGRWGWFSSRDSGPRPVFRLLSEETATGEVPVTMGHAGGIITINVSEADEARRADRQTRMGELYRTMLGHMRHEIGHFLFDRLMSRGGFAAEFRNMFGDERQDYAAALERHYDAPRPHGETHVTSYATAHPHEDWAETLAHLLHLVDSADSAAAAGLSGPDGPPPGYDAYADPDTDHVLDHAIGLSIAVTHVNRALDLPDLYPFVLTPAVREKMAFAHAALFAPSPPQA
ncbi:putative zinc-binding peptidase [Mameliella alba]|nr:putative zinc-binding peptidase [Antarctobacter heliothermus]MBY6145379.1 putative zinc-binding peptidase [Mameliella alba]MCA0955127.1 putative zinc-binding peptidase [Mameliella alba]